MNLIIEMPDDLARSLEGIATAQHKTVQQLTIERLRSLVEMDFSSRIGSPAALLAAVKAGPRLSAEDVDELDSAIAASRLPNVAGDVFSE